MGFFPGAASPGQCRIQILVDRLWVRGSSSDAQIFNRSDLREKIKDGNLGLPRTTEPLGEGESDFPNFQDAFTLLPWMVNPYSRRQLTREERIANHRISKSRRLLENTWWNISEPIQGVTVHHVAKAIGCQRHCFYMCGVAQHAEDKPGRSRQDTNPSK